MPTINLHTAKLFAIKDNNQRKITEIYDEYRGAFISFSKKNYDLPKDIAEDIYQDAFLAMHQNIQSGKLTNLTVPLRTYLFQIGKNKIFDYFKKKKNEIELERFPERSSSDSEWDNFDQFFDDEGSDIEKRSLIIYRTVSQMDSPCKEILFYFYWEKKKMEDIADLMKYNSADVAKSQKSRCMKKVTAYITEKLKEADLR
jgi:RNA polymerase sigma factor (sigma-70 family)